VILCGGLGTRLREETKFKPKPMVKIGGKMRETHGSMGVPMSPTEVMSNDFTVNLGKGNQLTYERSSGAL